MSSPEQHNNIASRYVRMCTFTRWSTELPPRVRFIPEYIHPHLCSHVTFNSATLKYNRLSSVDPQGDDGSQFVKGLLIDIE